MFVLLVDPCSAIDNKTATSIFLGSNSQNIDLSQHTRAAMRAAPSIPGQP